MRFILKTGIGSVSTFTTCDGKIHVPGDVVDLPPAYKGEAWLEPVRDFIYETEEQLINRLGYTPEVIHLGPKPPKSEKTNPEPEHIVAKPEKSKPHK